jgi:hypothetical protein
VNQTNQKINKMDINSVLLLCKEIKDSGKTPSMGLIKARASQTISIPTIIAALKQFKEMTDTDIKGLEEKVSAYQNTANTVSDLSSIQRIELLENEVSVLKFELKELKSLLEVSIEK